MRRLEDGEEYYSIGALQARSGIEVWTWTGDRYDQIRENMGIVFTNLQDAVDLVKLLKERKDAMDNLQD